MRQSHRSTKIALLLAFLMAVPVSSKATCTRECEVTLLRADCTVVPPGGDWREPNPIRVGADCERTCCSHPFLEQPRECRTEPDSTLATRYGMSRANSVDWLPGAFSFIEETCGHQYGLVYDRVVDAGDYQLFFSLSVPRDGQRGGLLKQTFRVETTGLGSPTVAPSATPSPTSYATASPPNCPAESLSLCRDEETRPDTCPCVTRTPTATETPNPPRCIGDCNGDGRVTVDELTRGVGLFLRPEPSDDVCPASDVNLDGHLQVTELIQAVNNALHGCSLFRCRPPNFGRPPCL